jgi:hypothetical protein
MGQGGTRGAIDTTAGCASASIQRLHHHHQHLHLPYFCVCATALGRCSRGKILWMGDGEGLEPTSRLLDVLVAFSATKLRENLNFNYYSIVHPRIFRI